jgi:WD40 repeat protein
VAISPDGNLLGICCSESAIILWDMQKNQVIGEIPDAPLIQTLIFTPNGDQLIAFDPKTQQIHYWDSKTQKPIMPSVKLAGHPNIYNSQSRISPDGRFLASIYSIREGFPANLLAVFDARTGEPLGSLKCQTGCDSITFSPDGKSLVLLNGYDLQVWEMDSITK